MYLNASTDSIEIILGGTVTANQLQWNVSYQDITSSGMTLPQSAGAGLTNNTTLVTMVAAPAASTTRQVTNINVYNADTATATVTVRKDVSATKYVLVQYALVSLDTLMWSREDGWRVVSGGSSAITALTGDVTASGPGSAAATIANQAVSYAKMQNVSAASRLLGRGSAAGAGSPEEITLGSGLSMTGTVLSASATAYTFSTGLTNSSGTITNNLSTGVAGGQSVIGGTAASNSLTLSSTSNATKGKILFGTSAYDEANNRLGIGTASPATPVHVVGRVTVSQDTTVATQTSAVITTDTANCNFVIVPTGTGALVAAAPNGAASGGNSRGQYAVDLQLSRSTGSTVASGNYSVVIGGQNNTASQSHTIAIGGLNNTSSSSEAVIVGGSSNVASGSSSLVIAGFNNQATASYASVLGGRGGYGYLYGQKTFSAGVFAATTGDAQSSLITYRRSITGTAQTELFLDGASVAAILNISSPGPTNGRLWNAKIQVSAICQTQGNGTVTVGESLVGNYAVGIKRIGTTTSLVGTVQTIHTAQTDTNMSTSVVTIDANDTNESLRIQFTPPLTAGSTTVIRVVATAYLTEVGY